MDGRTSSRVRPGTGGRIVRAVVADIAVRRTIPTVFLLDDEGRPTAWPARGAPELPPAYAPFVERYFAQPPPSRRVHSEVIDVDGVQTAVRIVPYHSAGASRYALIAERFVLRSTADSDEDVSPD